MIRAKFTAAEIHKTMLNKIAKMEKTMEARLIRIGNKFVRDARLNADFTDRTGNLRSSIGYVLIGDGTPIKADFEDTKNGLLGKAKAIEYATEITSGYTHGYVLVVVAGMEYAARVESHGFDVLTGSSIAATNELTKYFKKK